MERAEDKYGQTICTTSSLHSDTELERREFSTLLEGGVLLKPWALVVDGRVLTTSR